MEEGAGKDNGREAGEARDGKGWSKKLCRCISFRVLDNRNIKSRKFAEQYIILGKESERERGAKDLITRIGSCQTLLFHVKEQNKYFQYSTQSHPKEDRERVGVGGDRRQGDRE